MNGIKYRKAEEMKDSGVELLAMIPSNWDSGNLRWYLSCKSGDFISNTEVEKDCIEGKSIPVIGGNGVMGYCNKYNVKHKTIAVGRVGALCGNIHLLDSPCWITDNSLLITHIDDKIDIKYLEFILNDLNLNKYSRSTAQPLITGETIKKRSIRIPLIGEQQKIANFLNIKSAQFDSIISKKELLIKKLEEAKKSLISEVVTGKVKIIDGEIVKRQPEEMKDSGVEWLGMIPRSWKYSRIKYNTYLKGRIGWQGLKASEFIDEGPYLVTGTDFENGHINWDTCYHITNKRYEQAPEIQLNIDDLLITKDGTVGKLAYIEFLPDKASLNSHLLVIRPTSKKFTNKYLFWILSSECFKIYTGLLQNGSIMASLSQEKICNFSFANPSLLDQQEIVDFLDIKIAQLNSIISKEKATIEKLKQAKQSLISEAVTGKIDLRDWEIIEEGGLQ